MEDNKNKGQEPGKGIGRRDILKGLAAVPVLGAFAFSTFKKKDYDTALRESIMKELDIKAGTPPPSGSMAGDPLRLGIIGFGIRGEQLVRATGFATKKWKDDMYAANQKNPNDNRFPDFMRQEALNVRFTAVCDLFDVRLDAAADACTTDDNTPKKYKHFEDLLASPDVDGVIIATPDHWHAPISIAALKAGKHVYVEKPMTHKVAETYELYETAIANPNTVFAVGHQHRQTQSFLTAQDVIRKNILGHISLVQTNTNRNDDNGAWQYDIHEKANEETIEWMRFLGNAPQIPFNKEHFFRWRKWWAYGSGLSGDLLTHDFDRINCLLQMGMPKYVTATGGIYTHRDGRDVPDVFQAVMEYPEFYMGGSQEKGKEKGMTFMYSATLGNQYDRPTILMGHDATMEVGNSLTIYPDARSTRYAQMLKDKVVEPGTPLYAYNPAAKGVDGVTSATAKYFADKGLLYTYRDGRRVDSTHLHVREWLSCIRHGGKPSCGIQEGFEEAMAAHMGTLSLITGQRVEWDHATNRILNARTEVFDEMIVSMAKNYGAV